MSNLPPDILDKILKLVVKIDDCKNTLKVALLVCKSWHNVGVRYLYQEVHLNKKKIRRLKTALSNGKPTGSIYLKYGYFVKALYFSRGEVCFSNKHKARSPAFSFQEMDALLSFFPNLTVFACQESQQFIPYMRVLYYTQHPLKHLTYISAASDNTYVVNRQDSLMHYLTCYKFRLTITKLTIYCYNGGTIINQLADFPKLTELLFDSRHNAAVENYNPEEHLSIFKILMSSPKLNNLTYRADFSPQNQIVEEEHLNQLLAMQFGCTLRTLNLTIPNLSKPYVNFLSFHLPLSLDKISINTSKAELLTWAEHIGLKNVVHFCKRISHIKESNLAFFRDRSNPSSSSVTIQESYCNLFYRLAAAIKSDRLLYCKIEFDIYFRHASVQVDSNKNSLVMNYGFRFEEFTPPVPSDYQERFYEYDPTPLFDNLQISPFFHLHDVHFSLSGDDPALRFPHMFIQSVVRNCPRLQHFYLFIRFGFGQEATISFGKFHKFCSPFPDKSDIEKITGQDTTYLSVAQQCLGMETELWPTIASYLPHVKKITCSSEQSFHSLDHETPPEELPICYILDFSVFSELQVFAIDTNAFLYDSGICCFIIEFVSNNDKETETHLIKRVKTDCDTYSEEEWECAKLRSEEEEEEPLVQKHCRLTVILMDKENFKQFIILNNHFCYVFQPFKNATISLNGRSAYSHNRMTLDDHLALKFNEKYYD